MSESTYRLNRLIKARVLAVEEDARRVAAFPKHVSWGEIRFLSFVNHTAVAFREERREVYQFESSAALECALEELQQRQEPRGGAAREGAKLERGNSTTGL